jgi:hypothetical protein
MQWPAWLGGRRSDPYEDALRARAARLSRYISALQRERVVVEGVAARRAGELAALSAECRRRLVLVHSWGLFDLLETFYRQSVMLMRRGYLRAAADAAAGAALDEALITAEKHRSRALRDAEERAAELASPAGRLGQAPPRTAADAETLDLEAFCAAPEALRRASPSLPRLRAREAALTRELLALDEVLRGLAGELAEPSRAARGEALARAVAGEAARCAEEAAAAAEAAAALREARGGGGGGEGGEGGGEGVPLRAAAAWALPLLAGGGEGGGGGGCGLAAGDFSAAGGGRGGEAVAALLLLGAPPPLDEAGARELAARTAALPPPAAARFARAVDALRTLCAAACERRRAAAARGAEFERWLCDQRFSEGRFLQSWSHRTLVGGGGAGADGLRYVFGLHRFLSTFDPGPGYYLAALRREGVGAALAKVAYEAPPAGSGAGGPPASDGGARAPATPAPPPPAPPPRGAAGATPGAAYAALGSPSPSSPPSAPPQPPQPPPPPAQQQQQPPSRGRLPQPRLVASAVAHLAREACGGFDAPRAAAGAALVAAAVMPRLKA